MLASALVSLLDAHHGTDGNDDDGSLALALEVAICRTRPSPAACHRLYGIAAKCLTAVPQHESIVADARIRLARLGLGLTFDHTLAHLTALRDLLEGSAADWSTASRKWATMRWRLLHEALITLGIRRGAEGVSLLKQGVKLGKSRAEVWMSGDQRDGVDARAAEKQVLGLFAFERKAACADEQARAYIEIVAPVFRRGNAGQPLVRALNHVTTAAWLNEWSQRTLWTWLLLARDQVRRHQSGQRRDSLGLAQAEELYGRLLLELFSRTRHPVILQELQARIRAACRDPEWWRQGSAGSRISLVVEAHEVLAANSLPRPAGVLEPLIEAWQGRSVARERWDLGAHVVDSRRQQAITRLPVRLSRLWEKDGDLRRARQAIEIDPTTCDEASRLEMSIRRAYLDNDLSAAVLEVADAHFESLPSTTCLELAVALRCSPASRALAIAALRRCTDDRSSSSRRLALKAAIELAEIRATQGLWKVVLALAQDAVEDAEEETLVVAQGAQAVNDEGLIDALRDRLNLLAYTAACHDDAGLLAAFELLENARDVACAWQLVQQVDRRVRRQLEVPQGPGGGLTDAMMRQLQSEEGGMERSRLFAEVFSAVSLIGGSLRPIAGVNVVYVVASDKTTHALLLAADGDIQALPLDVDPRWLERQFGGVRMPSRDALSRPWHEIVQPILGRLHLTDAAPTPAKDSSPSSPPPYELPRICWIGIGGAANVPFHCARDANQDDGTMWHVVSSYAQSVGGLARLRKGIDVAKRMDRSEIGASHVDGKLMNAQRTGSPLTALISASSMSGPAQAILRAWQRALEVKAQVAIVELVDPELVPSGPRKDLVYIEAGSRVDLDDTLIVFDASAGSSPSSRAAAAAARHVITGLPRSADDPFAAFLFCEIFWATVLRSRRGGRPSAQSSASSSSAVASQEPRWTDYDVAYAVHVAIRALEARAGGPSGDSKTAAAWPWMVIRHLGP